MGSLKNLDMDGRIILKLILKAMSIKKIIFNPLIIGLAARIVQPV